MATEELTIVFKHGTLGIESALQAIQSVLSEYQVPSSGFELSEEPVDLAAILPRLRRAERKTFNLIGRGFVFHLATVRNFQLDFLEIRSADAQRISWDTWASKFVGNSNFVMAWIANVDYEFWQNADDPLQYSTKGKPYEHLPKKSNGLPPPLEKEIIDISANPARRLLRNGYYEAIGATMWLGEHFLTLTGADKSVIESTDWLRVSHPFPSVTRVQASVKCFTNAEGNSGQIQRKLRALLFPTIGDA